MPPTLQCKPLCALSGALSTRVIASASRTPKSLAVVSLATRSQPFSTTKAQSRVIPPESPLYITIPTPPQSIETKLPAVRGHLPRPRQIFKQRGAMSKLDSGFMAQTAPVSKSKIDGSKPKSEVQVRKWEMAESRRQSLAEGIQGLWERKQAYDSARRRAATTKFERNRRAGRRPEPLDEMFTRSTVLAATAKETKVTLDPQRFEKAEQARRAHAKLTAQKNESRQDAIARLYMASADFIIDEAELEAKVHDIFDNPKYINTALDKTDSQWGFGPPISIAALRRSTESARDDSKRATLASQRQKQLAEELMGGKMD